MSFNETEERLFAYVSRNLAWIQPAVATVLLVVFPRFLLVLTRARPRGCRRGLFPLVVP